MALLRRTKPILTVHFGDMHIGSSLALCPPEVITDDGGGHIPSPLEQWYWECWLRFWEDTAALKKQHRAHCIGICGGDARDGDHHKTTQIWAANENDQDRAVLQALGVAEPVLDEWVFIRGTPSHDGVAAQANERYGQAVEARGQQVRRNGDLYSWWVWTAEIAGVKFEVAHKPGTLSWVPHTKAPAVARHAQYTWTEYNQSKIEPPDVVIRHHVHYWSGPGCEQNTCCFFVPGWQGPTAYVRSGGVKSATSSNFQPGGLRLLCEDGSYQHFWKLYRPPSRVAWSR